eukprot:GDKJ01054090.1.p1 GENE.GDKJ01054090.1~~GDKJ01054090.1.p1  ORF type:complete len:968 (+),score=238.05 GDKJ01054090.1:387-2906(+)
MDIGHFATITSRLEAISMKRRKPDGGQNVEDDSEIFAFPYDWRFSPLDFDFAPVRKEIERRVNLKNRKVLLVTHSLGSLYALYFLNAYVDRAWKDKHIAGWVSANGVFAGSAKALQGVITGAEPDASVFTNNFMNSVNDGVPSMAAMATFNAFEYGDLLTVTIRGGTFLDQNGKEFHIDDITLPAKQFNQLFPVGSMRRVLSDRAVELDSSFLLNDPEVPVFCFSSEETLPNTPSSFSIARNTKGEIDLQELPQNEKMTFGDGFVPTWSQEFCRRWDSTVFSYRITTTDSKHVRHEHVIASSRRLARFLPEFIQRVSKEAFFFASPAAAGDIAFNQVTHSRPERYFDRLRKLKSLSLEAMAAAWTPDTQAGWMEYLFEDKTLSTIPPACGSTRMPTVPDFAGLSKMTPWDLLDLQEETTLWCPKVFMQTLFSSLKGSPSYQVFMPKDKDVPSFFRFEVGRDDDNRRELKSAEEEKEPQVSLKHILKKMKNAESSTSVDEVSATALLDAFKMRMYGYRVSAAALPGRGENADEVHISYGYERIQNDGTVPGELARKYQRFVIAPEYSPTSSSFASSIDMKNKQTSEKQQRKEEELHVENSSSDEHKSEVRQLQQNTPKSYRVVPVVDDYELFLAATHSLKKRETDVLPPRVASPSPLSFSSYGGSKSESEEKTDQEINEKISELESSMMASTKNIVVGLADAAKKSIFTVNPLSLYGDYGVQQLNTPLNAKIEVSIQNLKTGRVLQRNMIVPPVPVKPIHVLATHPPSLSLEQVYGDCGLRCIKGVFNLPRNPYTKALKEYVVHSKLVDVRSGDDLDEARKIRVLENGEGDAPVSAAERF